MAERLARGPAPRNLSRRRGRLVSMHAPRPRHPPARLRHTARRRRGLTLAVLFAGVLLFATDGARAQTPLDLEGTWFVLIHYQDASTANPEATRWLDLAWRFAYKGSRLEWTEYPLVYFEDGTGRFEARMGNPRARVLGAWEPSPSQRKAIDAGPRVNPRGVKIKTLRGSNASGWATSRRMTQTSALSVGYQENLSVQGLDALPVFTRTDVVGNALSHTQDSGSIYRVESIRDEGATLVGRYERDGIRTGRFRIWRTPPVRGLPEREGSPNDRAAERARKAYEAPLE